MRDEYYAKQMSETQATNQPSWETPSVQHPTMRHSGPAAPPPAPPAGTIDAGLQHLGQGLAFATELLGALEAHLDPVLAHVPVQAHEWPLALEPTCALAQQILERIEQVQHLSARLSAVLERLAL